MNDQETPRGVLHRIKVLSFDNEILYLRRPYVNILQYFADVFIGVDFYTMVRNVHDILTRHQKMIVND